MGNFVSFLVSNQIEDMLLQNVALGHLRTQQKQKGHTYILLILFPLKEAIKNFSYIL
jgi:hypothetical protein